MSQRIHQLVYYELCMFPGHYDSLLWGKGLGNGIHLGSITLYIFIPPEIVKTFSNDTISSERTLKSQSYEV